ncbi:zinc finger protein 211-like [Balaenoptera acutorostrata]|uniref:Zinc finger protein 211-like n=1 Tax=Balaenoptera acutorostrata TaxID=9767 RepID=A0ABM3SIT6_BALAC|nr:zinc finger protein 211-like [Balaenoptera acutorostrata]
MHFRENSSRRGGTSGLLLVAAILTALGLFSLRGTGVTGLKKCERRHCPRATEAGLRFGDTARSAPRQARETDRRVRVPPPLSTLTAPFRPRTAMASAAAALRDPPQDSMTFEDINVYFSWEEWRLLDEVQRHLYHDVMLENFTLISSLGCCCGAEDAEAPFERSISISVSQARTPKAPSFSQKNHFGEMCSLVLRSIFHLAEHEETQHSQKVFGCRICMKQFHFSANLQKLQKQHMEEKSFRNAVVRALFVKSCKCHVSRKPFTCEEVGKDFLATLGHLQPQTTHTREKPNEIAQREATLQSRGSHYSWGECKKTFSPKHALVQDQGVYPGRHCFVCSECGKTFRYKSSFVVHQRVHTGERLHVCGESGKSFRRTSTLNLHRRIHTGTRQ